jgi:hypothetical protein
MGGVAVVLGGIAMIDFGSLVNESAIPNAIGRATAKLTAVAAETAVCAGFGLIAACLLFSSSGPLGIWGAALTKLVFFAGGLILYWNYWYYILDPNGATVTSYLLVIGSGVQALFLLAAAAAALYKGAQR